MEILRLLLDTHILLWWIADDLKIKASAIEAIESKDNEILVSIASLWEIAIKVRTGKMKVDLQEVEAEVAAIGFTELPITTRHLEILVGLPKRHRDPFDHLLVAQAIGEQATLVTVDRQIRGYPVNVLA